MFSTPNVSSSVASPICQEGQSEWTFPILPFLPNFSFFSQFFPDFLLFFPIFGNFSLSRGALWPPCPYTGYATESQYVFRITWPIVYLILFFDVYLNGFYYVFCLHLYVTLHINVQWAENKDQLIDLFIDTGKKHGTEKHVFFFNLKQNGEYSLGNSCRLLTGCLPYFA